MIIMMLFPEEVSLSNVLIRVLLWLDPMIWRYVGSVLLNMLWDSQLNRDKKFPMDHWFSTFLLVPRTFLWPVWICWEIKYGKMSPQMKKRHFILTHLPVWQLRYVKKTPVQVSFKWILSLAVRLEITSPDQQTWLTSSDLHLAILEKVSATEIHHMPPWWK